MQWMQQKKFDKALFWNAKGYINSILVKPSVIAAAPLCAGHGFRQCL